jgi:glycosyltransferase involved in cell wall biosynthesis
MSKSGLSGGSVARDKRVAFVLPDLRGGGAERLTIDLMAGFVERGVAVDLVLQSAVGDLLPLVPDPVRIFDLAAPRLRYALTPLRRYYRQESPSGAIVAMWPLTVVGTLAALGLRPRPRLVVSDHCPVVQQYAGQPMAQIALRASLPWAYRLADGVVAVSAGLGRQIAGIALLPESAVTTVYNPVPAPLRSGAASDKIWRRVGARRILSVGALKEAKNFPLLIEAFALVAEREDAVLAIVGEGEMRPALEALAARRGLAERIFFPGFTTTPGDWYAGADLFVLTSDYEGFGNVLVEAMHCGLGIVATNCVSGPGEILRGGKWGRLVPPGDAHRLAEAILEALSDRPDPVAQRTRAAEFSVERAVNAYARLLGL